MTVYTFSQARQKFASLLEKARTEGEVLIKRKDGSLFTIKPVAKVESPLNVKGVNLKITAKEIIDVLREVRER